MFKGWHNYKIQIRIFPKFRLELFQNFNLRITSNNSNKNLKNLSHADEMLQINKQVWFIEAIH